MGRADMHIERQWFYYERDATVRSIVRTPTGDRDKATGTAWVARARHPKDHHEYGVQAIVDGAVQVTISKRARQDLQSALDHYLAGHPNGLDNPVMSV